MDIVLTILDPSGKVLSVAPLGGSPDNLGIGISALFTQPGTYSIEIQNEESGWFYANMTLHVQQYHFQRPFFYYGLVGIVSASLYPIIVFLAWVLTKKDK